MTENEALRLHLKLAVESLKNPVKVPSPPRQVSRTLMTEQPSAVVSPAGTLASATPLTPSQQEEVFIQEEWDDGSETDVDVVEEETMAVQSEMRDLLKDLTMFKRKLGDDHSRFLRPVMNGGI